MELKKVIGMISWFPNDYRRASRIEQVQKTFDQLGELFPTLPIMIIAQNWQDAQFAIKNQIIMYKYADGLGILGARKELRKRFLQSQYDYLIMVDDDIMIHSDSKETIKEYLRRIDNNPIGFACVKKDNSVSNRRSNHSYQPYAMAELNLCTISRFIYEQEPMVEIDATKGECYEDGVFSALLHYKWGRYEWDIPEGLYHEQYCNDDNRAISTWYKAFEGTKERIMSRRYYCLLLYIREHHDLPPEFLQYILKTIN